MLTKAERRLIRSLKQKKFRDQEGLFVVEGVKMVQEALNSGFCVRSLYTSKESIFLEPIQATLISEQEMSEISHLTTPSPALALVEKIKYDFVFAVDKADRSQLYLGLDAIRDPGNLGTIVRIADWFGIKAIFASVDTVDSYNPKVIQASMGAIFRVPMYYVELSKIIKELEIPVWGTALDGKPVYEAQLSSNGIVIIGNEANGISPALRERIDHTLLIPSFPPHSLTSESLNASVAAAIICSEFRRRTFVS